MQPPITIRPALPDDAPALQACAEAAYARHALAMGQKPAPLLADYPVQIRAGQVHLAETGGRLAGFIVFAPETDHMLLENVAVLPSHAGQGIGKALIAHCETAARALGLPEVRLYTNVKMVDNLSIYPGLGYVETGRRIEDGFHRVFFAKRLG